MIKKLAFGFISLFFLLILTTSIAFFWARNENIPERGGLAGESLALAVLDAPVTVKRDRYGVPYIYAQSLADVIRAQGFVTAQDRLTQMLLMREAANGRLAELIGNRGEPTDVLVRAIGINRLARRFAAKMESPSRELHEWYLEGVNSYLTTQSHEFPLLLRFLAHSPGPYTLEDICAHYLLQAYDLTENWRSEWLAQTLVDQLGRGPAAQISHLSYNPDDGSEWSSQYAGAADKPLRLLDGNIQVPTRPGGGSNSWAMSPRRSARGAPILANDPHLNATRLPGIWYPVALITPDWRAVGVAGAGWPGLAVGRSNHIAWGVTNSTADISDLFLERDDPEREGHYLEGDQSIPYEIVHESVRIRDPEAPGGVRERELTIRQTRRGPVISKFLLGDSGGYTVSFRWSVAENLGSQVGVDQLMLARDVFEAGEAIRNIVGALNYNVADTQGNIAHYTSGPVPVRRKGDGAIPMPVVDGQDNWMGFVPFEQAPSSLNPPRGWVGNANNRTVDRTFNGTWSSYSAPSWRYRRMLELFENDRVLSAEEHWAAIIDTVNTLARELVPIFVRALETDSATEAAADMLRDWNYRDDANQAAPALFQTMIRRLVGRIFADELGSLVWSYQGSIYFWQERVHRMLVAGESDWFDDRRTPQRESLDELIRKAALDSWSHLKARLGEDPQRWRWGDLGSLEFTNPAQLPGRLVNGFLGGGEYPRNGSPETLLGSFGEPDFGAWAIDSVRFVADLGDPDKVLAVIPGGVSGRLFDPHLNDQLPIWLSGEVNYWWFSDEAISANTQRELKLEP